MFALAELLLPAVSVATVHTRWEATAPLSAAPSAAPIAASPSASESKGVAATSSACGLLSGVLQLIGALSVGTGSFAFDRMPNVSSVRAESIVSCAVQLMRALYHASSAHGWDDAVSAALNSAALDVDASVLDLSLSVLTPTASLASSASAVRDARLSVYALSGALQVCGALTDPIRLGARVLVISADATAARVDSSSTVQGTATVVGYSGSKLMIVHDSQSAQGPVLIERSAVEAVAAHAPVPLNGVNEWVRLTAVWKRLHALSIAADSKKDTELFRSTLSSSILRVLLLAVTSNMPNVPVLQTVLGSGTLTWI